MNQAVRWAAHGPVNLSQHTVLIIILACFALIGLRRGVNRELLSFVGIVISIWITDKLGPTLHERINRFYRLGRFALSGGLSADDPAAEWQKAKQLPDLIGGEAAINALVFCFFFLIVLLFVIIGQRRIQGPKTRVLQVLGAAVGAINGFLVASIILPRVVTGTTMTINVPTKEVTNALVDTGNIGLLVVFLVVTVIALGLHNASGKK
jgi:uncharacterized membrane protein required for colicin V production